MAAAADAAIVVVGATAGARARADTAAVTTGARVEAGFFLEKTSRPGASFLFGVASSFIAAIYTDVGSATGCSSVSIAA